MPSEGERLTEEYLEREATEAAERRAEGAAERGAERRAERGAARGAEREGERGAEEGAERKASKEAVNEAKKDVEKKLEKKIGKKAAAAVAAVVGYVLNFLVFLGVEAETLAALGAEGAIAIAVSLIGLFITIVGACASVIISYLKSSDIPDKVNKVQASNGSVIMAEPVIDDMNSKPIIEGRYLTRTEKGLNFITNIANHPIFLMVFLGIAVAALFTTIITGVFQSYFSGPDRDSLLRDQLKYAMDGNIIDMNTLSIVGGGLDSDSAKEETCRNLGTTDKDICDANKCGLNKENTNCTSCKKLLQSLENTNDDDDDDGESKVDKYAFYSFIIYKTGSKLDQKIFGGYIKSKLAMGLKKAGSMIMQTIKKILYKSAAEAAEKVAREAAEKGAEMGTEMAVEAGVLAVGGPLDLVIAPVFAIIDTIQMLGMVLDIIDISDFRTYISNQQNLIQRNQLDGGYLKLIVNGHSVINQTAVPPIEDQSPSMYQLDTMINPLMNSKIPEASILFKIGVCFMEARIAWMVKILSLDVSEIKSDYPGNTTLFNYHDEIIKIHKRGEAAGYSGGSPSPGYNEPSVGLQDIEYIDPNKAETLNPGYKYLGGYCQYEIEYYQAIDNFVNYLHEERDEYFMEYIEKAMKEYATNSDALDSIKNNTTLETEDIWGDDLSGECSDIINWWKTHNGSSDTSSSYTGSDLIKNYGNGTIHLSGVSLTEEGCLLLNQILDYESYMFTKRNENDPTYKLKNTPQQQDPPLSLVQLPKVVFSENYRVVVQNSDGKDSVISRRNEGDIKLPQYYPSTANIEIKCKYGYQAMKAGLPDDLNSIDDYEASVGLSFLARGDGSEAWSNWLPLLFGVIFDENKGVCKYDGQRYCARMGRQPKSLKYENTGGTRGIQYETCDDDELGALADWGVGETICREANRFFGWHC